MFESGCGPPTQDERRDPSWSSNEGRIGQGDRRFGGFLLGEDRGHANGRVFVDAQGNVVRMTQREAEQNDEEEKSDVMKAMAKSFENFPWLVSRASRAKRNTEAGDILRHPFPIRSSEDDNGRDRRHREPWIYFL